MHKPLAGKRIVLGVTGGIAAYKAADLTSKLVQLGADVHVLLTSGATRFVQPLTFQALTRNPVFTGVFEGWEGSTAGHVTLAAKADVVVVAPATATSIARMAAGMAEDMLGAVLLATSAPILIAPAMEHHMWHHPATQANVDLLQERGVGVIPPETGRLASGASGDGRLASMEAILADIRRVLARGGSLSGRKIVVSAGGTHEAIDPVRFIGNASSGTMGNALVIAAADRGAEVTLIAGPTVAQTPAGMNVVRVISARDMQAAVEQAASDADVLIMAAAVADYRPASPQDRKVKKSPEGHDLTLELTENPDILAGINPRAGLVKVGFAAETNDLIENAKFKLERKNLDMIIANDAEATIGSDRSRATILQRGLDLPEELPEMRKAELADHILDRIELMLPKVEA